MVFLLRVRDVRESKIADNPLHAMFGDRTSDEAKASVEVRPVKTRRLHSIMTDSLHLLTFSGETANSKENKNDRDRRGTSPGPLRPRSARDLRHPILRI